MMIAPAVVALTIVAMPTLALIFEQSIWFGGDPWAPNFGYVPSGHWVADPRLGFFVIPWLCGVVMRDRPCRPWIWAAVGLDLLALSSWIFLRRFMVVGPGSLLIWPDSFVSALHGEAITTPWMPHPFHAFIHLIRPSTVGEVVDLLSLFVLLGLLARSSRRASSRRIRGTAVLVMLLTPTVEWCGRMGCDRFYGFGTPPHRGVLGGYFVPRPSFYDLLQGCLLAALILFGMAILFRTRAPSRNPEVPPLKTNDALS